MDENDLSEIRDQESMVDGRMEDKVLESLKEQSLSKRALVRKTRYKAAMVDAVVKSLVGRGMVKVVTVTNSSGGRPTLFISKISDEELRQRRLKAMNRLGI